MGKGSETVVQLRRHVLTEEEARQRRYGVIPELRLRPDRTIDVSDPLQLAVVLSALSGGEIRNTLIADAEAQGVVVPVGRYVGLVAIELATGDFHALKGGRLEPVGLEDGEVEQVDPNAAWGQAPQRVG